MASQRAAERLLVISALAAFVLAAAGCGGDSSSSTAADASSSTVASKDAAPSASAKEEAAPGFPAGGNGDSAAGAGTQGSKSEPGSTKSGQGAGSKRGPRIAQPKGAPEPGLTEEQRREATVVSMSLRSPSVLPGAESTGRLPSKYTCEGANTWPALQWSGTPDGTAELALFAMNVQPVEGKLFFDWAITGLDPDLEEIAAGKLPKGAIVGRNSFGKTGYSICPAEGGEIYMFGLYALAEKLPAEEGFDPRELRKAVLDVSGNAGFLPVSYGRE